MPRYEQLCRNLANSFIRHTNSYYGRENDNSQRLPAEFCVPTKQQAKSKYGSRLKSYVFLRHDAIGKLVQPPYGGPHQFISRAKRTIAIEVSNKNVIVPLDRPKRLKFYCTITLNTITSKIAK